MCHPKTHNLWRDREGRRQLPSNMNSGKYKACPVWRGNWERSRVSAEQRKASLRKGACFGACTGPRGRRGGTGGGMGRAEAPVEQRQPAGRGVTGTLEGAGEGWFQTGRFMKYVAQAEVPEGRQQRFWFRPCSNPLGDPEKPFLCRIRKEQKLRGYVSNSDRMP